MDTVVGVLCERIKVEEKWLIEMLAEAGIPARQLLPHSAPLPLDPSPSGPLAAEVAGGHAAAAPGIVVDRCADRAVAAALIPWLIQQGSLVLDGGLAAAEDRMRVARVLAAAGIPRPRTFVTTSEDSGLTAVRELGVPATMLPRDPGSAEIPFIDIEIAEAVLEHREVLGGSAAAIGLIQSGTRENGTFTDFLVVDGCAVACSDLAQANLAERTAEVLGAKLLGVTVADAGSGFIVWDAQPVPHFRECLANDDLQRKLRTAFLGLIGSAARQASHRGRVMQMPLVSSVIEGHTIRKEAGDGVVLSA